MPNPGCAPAHDVFRKGPVHACCTHRLHELAVRVCIFHGAYSFTEEVTVRHDHSAPVVRWASVAGRC